LCCRIRCRVFAARPSTRTEIDGDPPADDDDQHRRFDLGTQDFES
jgi:hypothetical protein